MVNKMNRLIKINPDDLPIRKIMKRIQNECTVWNEYHLNQPSCDRCGNDIPIEVHNMFQTNTRGFCSYSCKNPHEVVSVHVAINLMPHMRRMKREIRRIKNEFIKRN